MRAAVALVLGTGLWGGALAQVEHVEYVGPVDLRAFDCQPEAASSFITRFCERQGTVIVTMGGRNYAYCMERKIYQEWRSAPSRGAFYNARIKGRHRCKPP